MTLKKAFLGSRELRRAGMNRTRYSRSEAQVDRNKKRSLNSIGLQSRLAANLNKIGV